MNVDIKKVVNSFLNYYPKDLYILYNKYIMAGPYSNSETVGNYLLILNEDIISEFNEHKLDSSSIYYINNIRNHKDDFFESLEKIKNEDKLNQLKSNFERLLKDVLGVSEWSDFSFTNEELTILFEDRLTVIFKNKDNENVYIYLSKSIIPGFSKTNYSEYVYSFIEYPNFDLNGFNVFTHTSFFDGYMQYFIIK